MRPDAAYAVAAVALVLVATALHGLFGLPGSRTTSDFFVASRRVGARRNAAAISGEYLSAASFLGAAGLIWSSGADLLWLPVGYTIGFVVLLLYVAAPLRRSGAYTLPDFAETRLESRTVRLVCSALVVLVGWLYLVAQLVGASVVLTALTGAPPWAGAMAVATVVVLVVAAGGMRSITGIQAVQYFVKLACLAVPVLVLLGVWLRDGLPAPRVDLGAWGVPFTGFGGREQLLLRERSHQRLDVDHRWHRYSRPNNDGSQSIRLIENPARPNSSNRKSSVKPSSNQRCWRTTATTSLCSLSPHGYGTAAYGCSTIGSPPRITRPPGSSRSGRIRTTRWKSRQW